MSESRTELLAWMNDLLQLGYTKVEQCGTGAAHCQIMDSIFRDVSFGFGSFERSCIGQQTKDGTARKGCDNAGTMLRLD
ncbi:hypothetical protein HDU97_004942 [Phlyctochytrium planicorne]|nr:hypothetical protein HDU97_004942 [Phlyctochytrium planicorne]